MEKISENSGIHRDWYEKAKTVTLETLPSFIDALLTTYQHDYGTICHAIAASCIATAWAIDSSPQGGITGFQADFIMWEFISNWKYSNNKTGLRIIDYDAFLYPQYAGTCDKILSKSTWEAIKKEAQSNIEQADAKYVEYMMAVAKYKIDIADFIERYPDYYENRKHYDLLCMGTGEQCEAEEKTIVGGFEFAPKEPSEPLRNDSAVYLHWNSIVNGIVPFGYKIDGE